MESFFDKVERKDYGVDMIHFRLIFLVALLFGFLFPFEGNSSSVSGSVSSYNINSYDGVDADFSHLQEQGIIVTGRRDVSGSFDQVTLLPGSVANIKGSLVVGKGGIHSPSSDGVFINGGVLTSSVGMIDIHLTGSHPSATTYVTAAITDYQGRKVGFRVGGKVSGTSPVGPYGCVYIQGGGHSFTGDVIIKGRNEIAFDAIGVVARGNIYINDGGWLYIRNSGQISSSSMVTLNNGAFAFHPNVRLALVEKFHRLVVNERGYINFHYKPNLHKGRSLYLDDLMISNRSELVIGDWVSGATKLLVRKDSEHLADALGKIKFGHIKGGGVAKVREYNNEYWEIFAMVPEPATYGAILATVGLGLVFWKKCRSGKPNPREDIN